MKFIDKKELFESIRASASYVIDLEARLPDQVFRKGFQEFLFIDVDEVFTEEFYEWMNNFVVSVGECAWYFLNPEPWEPIFNYGIYPAFEVRINEPYEDYWRIVSQEPSQDTNYALFYAGTSRFILFSQSFKWCVLIDRKSELAIAGFSSQDVAAKFRAGFGNENVFNVNQAIDMFVAPAYFGLVRVSTQKGLKKNYG